MTEGLVWSALLLVFMGLGWLGWQEYQKVESYRTWAQQFERSKYDIYAVLGQSGETLTWGCPTRKGPVDLESCSFAEIKAVKLRIDDQIADWQHPPEKGRKVCIELVLQKISEPVQIPFTEISLAVDWSRYLQQVIVDAPPTRDSKNEVEA